MLREPVAPNISAVAASDEVRERFVSYVALLERWQETHNLVGPGTLDNVWERHITDSAQLIDLYPDARRWLDLGSGAGFPGLVIAILLSDVESASVTLVESNQKKCAFLREAVRVTGASAEIVCDRIESVAKRWTEPLDVITARALAPLSELCTFIEPLMQGETVAVFHKGRGFEDEIRAARQIWDIDLVEHESRVGEGVLVAIHRLQRRVRR